MDKIFNNREIATLIWLIVIFVFMLVNGRTRTPLLGFIKSFFSGKILVFNLYMAFYFMVILYILYLIRFWDFTFLKDSIEWFLFTGIILVYNTFTEGRYKQTDGKDKQLFKKIVNENITLLLILEFIINTYTFSLPIELILLPTLTIIVVLGEMAKSNSQYKSAEKLIVRLEVAIGLLFVVFAIMKVFVDFKSFWTIYTLKSFLLPIILTLSFTPFIYCTLLYLKYETLFFRLDIRDRKSKELKNYMKKRIKKCCLLNINKLEKLSSSDSFYDLVKSKSRKEIDMTIATFKKEYGK